MDGMPCKKCLASFARATVDPKHPLETVSLRAGLDALSKRLVDLLTLLKLIETINFFITHRVSMIFCMLRTCPAFFHLYCSNKSKITHNSVPSKVRNLSYLEVLSRNFLSCSCLSPQTVNYSGENKNMEVKKLPQNSPVMMDSVEIIVSLLVSHRYTW